MMEPALYALQDFILETMDFANNQTPCAKHLIKETETVYLASLDLH